MADYLLDTNHLSAALHKVSKVRDRIHQARKAGHRFIVCLPVLCELEAGIQQTAKPDDYRRQLRHLRRHVRRWALDDETARRYQSEIRCQRPRQPPGLQGKNGALQRRLRSAKERPFAGAKGDSQSLQDYAC